MATSSKPECYKVVVSVEKVISLGSAFPNFSPTSEGPGLKTIKFKNAEGPNTNVGIFLDLDDIDSKRFAKKRLLDSVKRALELTFKGASEATSAEESQESQDPCSASEGSPSVMTGETSVRSEDRSSNWEDIDDEVEVKQEIIEESEEEKSSVSARSEIENVFGTSSEGEEEPATPTSLPNVHDAFSNFLMNSFEVSSLESTPPKDGDLNQEQDEEEDCEKSRTVIKTPVKTSTPKTPLGRAEANVAPSAETTPAFLPPRKTPKTPASEAPSTRFVLGSSSSSKEEEEDLLKVTGRTPYSATASAKKTKKRRSAASRGKSPAVSEVSGKSLFSSSSDSEGLVQKGRKPIASSTFLSEPRSSKPKSTSKFPAAPARPLVLYSSESDSEIEVEQASEHSQTSATILKRQTEEALPQSSTSLATKTSKKNQQTQSEEAGTSAATSVPVQNQESSQAAAAQPQTKTSAQKTVRIARRNVTKNSEAGDENDESLRDATPTSQRLLRSALDKSHLVDGIVFPKGKRAI